MIIKYKFENLNKIINSSRSNPYYANTIKQKETNIVALLFNGKKINTFPLTIVFKWHIKSKMCMKNICNGCKYETRCEEKTL